MNKRTGKLLRMAAGLLVPAVLVLIAYGLISVVADVRPLLTILHLATVAWTIFFCRTGLTRVTLLPLSFLVSIAGPWVQETIRDSSWFPYIGTSLLAIFYALPWALVAFIIATRTVMRKRKKGSAMIPLDPPGGKEE